MKQKHYVKCEVRLITGKILEVNMRVNDCHDKKQANRQAIETLNTEMPSAMAIRIIKTQTESEYNTENFNGERW